MHQHNHHFPHVHDHHHDDPDHYHHNHDDGEHDDGAALKKSLQKRWRWLLAAGIVLLVYLTLYTVRETDFVLITQFGRPLYTISAAGLHAKWFFQTANYFDRRLHVYNPRPSEFLTRDRRIS